MTHKHKLLSVFFLLQLLFSIALSAQESQSKSLSESEATLKEKIKSRSGYEIEDTGFAGRSTVSKQLYMDDIFVPEHLRFPEFDRSLQPYYDWKRTVRQKTDVQLGQDYTSLFQRASDSLTDINSASGGVYRFFGRWLATGKGTKNTGALIFKIQHSHNYQKQVVPEKLGDELGYLGSTGLFYSDIGLVLYDLFWHQRFNEGKTDFLIGRLDPADYVNIIAYLDEWSTFQNSNILLNVTIAAPESGFGIGIRHTVNNQWYFKFNANDANGRLHETGFFDQGAEFFSFAEIGWKPSISNAEFNDVHITYWHIDQRINENVPEGEGVAFAASWSFEKEWILFARTGQSHGADALMKRSYTVGANHIWKAYFDTFGLAINYGEPADDQLRDQTSIETYLKIKLTQNITITPSYQILINPALNQQHDHIQVVGLRFRVTL